MKLKDLCEYLENAVPLAFQESYDNSGLQVGNPEQEINSGLLTLDVTEDVVEEALRLKCNIIISHHPLIFGGIKQISGKTPTGRIISSCIKNDISVYSAHTNLDIAGHGVSRIMAEKLGLKDIKVLSALENQLIKLVTYVPLSHADKVRNAIFAEGAGVIGKYDCCSFNAEGKGSFRGNEDSEPYAGEKGKLHFEDEVRIETVMYAYMKDRVMKALLEAHPYEEVAYDLYNLANRNIDAGLGAVGNLPEPMDGNDFLVLVSRVLGAEGLRYSALPGKPVSRVAVCGGAGASLISMALAERSDAFVTAEVKYHSFHDAAGKILLVDAGHFETEKFATELLMELIIKKFPKFALRFSEKNTNPINYL